MKVNCRGSVMRSEGGPETFRLLLISDLRCSRRGGSCRRTWSPNKRHSRTGAAQRTNRHSKVFLNGPDARSDTFIFGFPLATCPSLDHGF
jgi:hypothetical protein